MSQPRVSFRHPPPLCSFLFAIVLLVATFYTLHHPDATPPHLFSPNKHNSLTLRRLFLSSASNATVSSYLHSLTRHPHLAGTKPSLDTLNYVLNHFQSLRLDDTRVAEYEALLSYPTHFSLTARFSNDNTTLEFDLNDDVSSSSDVVMPYHAYSPSGSASGNVVFVNHGEERDYRALEMVGVSVRGCLVLVRKGETLGRGVIVKTAETKGALGVLIYDEKDGGGLGGIERGTVMRGIGDPVTPGWPGVVGGEKLSLEDDLVSKRFPKIPSLPLSLHNAEIILASLARAKAPVEWQTGRVGSSQRVGPGRVVVNMSLQVEMKMKKIHNVVATIRGSEEPDRYVILGNHRDAWTYGAVDPNSGTSALLDIGRRFSLLLESGWRPRRSILLCSWDAEEFGMVGSTEWVEEHVLNLGASAVAYLNVDCAVQGSGFFAGATPQLDNVLVDALKLVQDPDDVTLTVEETFKSQNNIIERLSRVDSDFSGFLHHAGIPSIDMYYGADYPVYHTAFDSYDWMIRNADPLFHRHVAMAGIWGLLGIILADEPVLPFDYISYAQQLQAHRDTLSKLLEGKVSVDPLSVAIQEFSLVTREVADEAKKLKKGAYSKNDVAGAAKRRELNDRMMLAERGFLDSEGIRGKEWFKHLVYGPAAEPESKLGFFPGIADAIATNSSEGVIKHEIWRVTRAIQRASKALKGGFT
ncbi:putative glutamate carboxypeptidase 2 [Raphanus sativus]|uniref:glutamate carboxypeptidase II n=2 Tax=Raphanus sativus TaxID=3726 RepID=A0A9W3CR01_RAPSA|nr:probable glutamate carboxypeptidase AMP1 [Raphanus sativus]XP_056853837.1 probable glutamate carboxypeptidase AMP1 [Raphanus sativus]XP_056853838.1 probable glutamate carboxypeptidase AMP1 [Raphanus sativus]XP_056853839.1 probable glutamate carboxypeptidase AMP1 [Raphanus sativus]XP_056853840.1 probable glutamate carboxypeptidase AMP1 [Raphanus sativus]XP_056853841.1 probable glutamate carboxypeptidase AMP1 [Raphanus sativus]XP_056853842.1 probable glutamate carboxypeptidase AMP1 [Raphanus